MPGIVARAAIPYRFDVTAKLASDLVRTPQLIFVI
jgi:hypothetical protein